MINKDKIVSILERFGVWVHGSGERKAEFRLSAASFEQAVINLTNLPRENVATVVLDARDVALQLAKEIQAIYPPKDRDAPIDMELFCPACGTQHIDAPETDAEYAQRIANVPPQGESDFDIVQWTNPPHRSHLCAACGHQWRPADVPTNGVASIKTRGKNDSPKVTGQIKLIGEYAEIESERASQLHTLDVQSTPFCVASVSRVLVFGCYHTTIELAAREELSDAEFARYNFCMTDNLDVRIECLPVKPSSQYRPFRFEERGGELWLSCDGASVNLTCYADNRGGIVGSNMKAAIEEQLTLIRAGKA